MRRTIAAALALGGLLALSACKAPATSSAAQPTSAGSTESTETPSATPSGAAPASPTIEKRRVTVTQRIPYGTRRISDSTLKKGTTRVLTAGRSGVRKLTYEVTLRNGVRTGRHLLRTVIARRPVTKVVAVGTHQATASRCDPNYAGACVPIASDVDCAGGGGNGPAYVQGPVQVVGTDIYDLDRDGDGTACD